MGKRRGAGVYKRKVKAILENNKSLVTAVQNYRCESSLKEKMWRETSSVNMEHIFSARLKLNKLAEVLKEACLSVEEILSVLQLCSSVFPPEFISNNRKSCSKKRRRHSKASLIEPIKEAQEWLSKPEDNFLADILLLNQDGSNPVFSSTLKDCQSCYESNSTDSSTKSDESVMPQELTVAHESVKLTDLACGLTKTSLGSATKIPKETKKVSVPKSRMIRKPSASSARKRLPNKRLQNSQALKCIPISDEVLPVLQDDPQQAVLAKKSKLSNEPTAMNTKQCLGKTKLSLSSKKNNKRSYVKDTFNEESDNENSDNFTDKPNLGSNTLDVIDQFEATVSLTKICSVTDPLSPEKCNKEGENKDALGDMSENKNTENFYNESNQADGTFSAINQSKTPVSTTLSCLITNQDNCDIEINHSNLPDHPKNDKAQSHGTSVHDQNLQDSKDIEQNDIFKSTANPIAQKPSKTDYDVHEPCNNYSTSYLNESINVNSLPKSIMVSGNKKSPTKKCKTRNKVNFCFDDATTDKRVVKSNQSKKKLNRMLLVPENEKGVSSCMSPQRPILQSVENIFYLSENLSKNIFVVSAEVHQPPSHSVKKLSTSPRNINKNLQPCVLLTDVMETHKSIISCDSLEDISSCSGVPVKEGSNSKASKRGNKDSVINTENSHSAPQQPERTVARCRGAVSYREPNLNRKMRRI